MPHDLIALGLNAIDVLIRLPANVRKDDKQMADSLIIQGGAPTGSGAAGVARLGYNVAYVARIGNNTASAIAVEEFRKNDVRTDLFVRDEASRPALALVEIDPVTAGRTVFIQMKNYGFLRPEDIPVPAIRSARVLLVDSYDLNATETALRAAANSECRSVLDFESGDRKRMTELLRLGTDPILPLACARELTGTTAPETVVRALSGLCPGQVVTTDGINGSWAWDRSRNTVHHQPAFRVASVDTTGCGDAFHAGYIVGLLEGWSLALRLEFGALLASRVATSVGGRTALPWRKELLSLLRPEVSSALRSSLQHIYEYPDKNPC
jgi:sulfofructose kinase